MACSGGCGCSGTCGGGATATQHEAIDVIDAPPGCKCVCECVEPKGPTPVPTYSFGILASMSSPAAPSHGGDAWLAEVSGPDDLTAWFRARAASGVATSIIAPPGGTGGAGFGAFGGSNTAARRFIASFAAVPAPIPLARVRPSAPFGIGELPRAPAMPTPSVPTQVAKDEPLPTIDASGAPGRAAIRGRLSVAPPSGYIVPADGLRDGVGPSFPRRKALSPRWTGIARRNGPAASPTARALWDPFDETDPDPISLRRVPDTVAVSANGDGRPRALVADPRSPAVPDLVSLASDVEEGSGFATNGVPEDSIADTVDTTRDTATSEPVTGVGPAASDIDAVSPPTHHLGDSAASAATHPPQGSPGPVNMGAQRSPGAQAPRTPGLGSASGPTVVAQGGRSMGGSIGPQAGFEAPGVLSGRPGGRSSAGSDFAAAVSAAAGSNRAWELINSMPDAASTTRQTESAKDAHNYAQLKVNALIASGVFGSHDQAQKRVDEAAARAIREQTRQARVDSRSGNEDSARAARAAKADARAARDAATDAKRAVANLHGKGESSLNKAASGAAADAKRAARKAADAAKSAERAAKYGSFDAATKKAADAAKAAEEAKRAQEKAAQAVADAKKAADAKKDGSQTPPGTKPNDPSPPPGGDPPRKPDDPPAAGGAGSAPENKHPECGPLPCGKPPNPCSGWGSSFKCHWEIENASGGGGVGGGALDQPPGFGSGWGPYGLPQTVSDQDGSGAPPAIPVKPLNAAPEPAQSAKPAGRSTKDRREEAILNAFVKKYTQFLYKELRSRGYSSLEAKRLLRAHEQELRDLMAGRLAISTMRSRADERHRPFYDFMLMRNEYRCLTILGADNGGDWRTLVQFARDADARVHIRIENLLQGFTPVDLDNMDEELEKIGIKPNTPEAAQLRTKLESELPGPALLTLWTDREIRDKLKALNGGPGAARLLFGDLDESDVNYWLIGPAKQGWLQAGELALTAITFGLFKLARLGGSVWQKPLVTALVAFASGAAYGAGLSLWSQVVANEGLTDIDWPGVSKAAFVSGSLATVLAGGQALAEQRAARFAAKCQLEFRLALANEFPGNAGGKPPAVNVAGEGEIPGVVNQNVPDIERP